jgi:sulfotransferase family protein
MKPTFLVIGAARCGTTSMCELLGSHPQVFLSDPKEVNFFCNDELYAKGREWYESFFAQAGNRRARGEGSARYGMPTDFPDLVERIAGYLPDCRLIYMVRHPLRRIESDWKLRVILRSPWLEESFSETVLKHPGILRMSAYWTQISRYRERFADEQIRVVFFEDFLRGPDAELARCFRHLGVDATVTIENSARARNSAEGLAWRRDPRMLRRFQRTSLFKRARALIPQSLRTSLRHVLTKAGTKEDLRTEWDESAKRYAVEQLAEDCRKFLGYCGKPPDYWDLEKA